MCSRAPTVGLAIAPIRGDQGTPSQPPRISGTDNGTEPSHLELHRTLGAPRKGVSKGPRMNTGTGAAKPNAALARLVQRSDFNQASSATASQRNIVMDAGYFLTCSTNKEWVSTCMANEEFLRQCMEQRDRLQLLLSNTERDTLFKETPTATITPSDEVSSMYEEFPTITSSLHQECKDQGGPVLGNKNDNGWDTVRRKRKRNEKAAEQRELSEGRVQKPPTQTVVLRPICKRNVEDFTTKELRTAIEKIGVNNVDDFTVHRHEKANTIAITTRNSSLVSKFLQIKEIPNEQHGPLAVQPYKAVSSNETRGVIYLNSAHDEPETLVEDLRCYTHRIVAARALGMKKKTILVTFEGKTLPRHVRYVFEVYRVSDYRPRPLVCFGCHQIGHKADVCPIKIKRCGSCGHEHGEVEECQAPPNCVNCDGTHVATSNDCPKRKIPPRNNTRRKNQRTMSATQGDTYTPLSQRTLTPTPSQPTMVSMNNQWANTVRMHKGPTDPARSLYPLTLSSTANTQKRQPGQQSPTSQLPRIPSRDPLDWEVRFAALSRRVEDGFASVQSNTSRIERLESLAMEILTKVNSIGEKFDQFLDPNHGR